MMVHLPPFPLEVEGADRGWGIRNPYPLVGVMMEEEFFYCGWCRCEGLCLLCVEGGHLGFTPIAVSHGLHLQGGVDIVGWRLVLLALDVIPQDMSCVVCLRRKGDGND